MQKSSSWDHPSDTVNTVCALPYLCTNASTLVGRNKLHTFGGSLILLPETYAAVLANPFNIIQTDQS